ncbi:beta strand repeat-containing protein, partial [Microcystis aeruginosa]|uniref:beta strand repeat-containing protein n=1 Tax=Microcystis aeruginosa TaxID=1126 RepID=UPI0023428C27
FGSGLQIIDISNPTNPNLKGNYDTSGSALDVQIVGNYAYVADGGAGLQIIDISNPTIPIFKGNYDTSGGAEDVQVMGKYAYVADSSGGLKIIDVSEFTSPQTVTLSISPSSVSEDGTANMAYTFTRSGVTTDALTVNYTVGGTATFSTDYTQSGAATFTSTTGTVTFAANATTAKVTIDPTADTIVENNETVALTLAAGTGYTVGTTTSVTGTITNDDTSVTLAVSPASVTEDGTTNLIYTFTRTGVTTNTLTVNYILGGTATLNTDYTRTGTNNTVTFAAGSSTATVTVDPTPDTIVEPNETVILTLATGTGYTVGTPNAATGTITNDDTSVTLAVSPASVTEDGTTNLIYTFTRNGVTTNPLTVNYTLGGTATLNTDYTRTGTNNTVTFAAGSSTATVTVDPTADTIVEPNETVILTLATGTGYTIGTPNAATGTITNDDTSVTLAVSPASVTEDGTTNLIYTFTRNGVTTNPLTVNYTLGGTATLNTDYTRTGTNNTVTFAAGSSTATVTVDPTPDTIVEPDETVILTLAAGTGYTVGTPNAATGTITNVTLPSVTLAVSPSSVSEDGTSNLIYIFIRTGDTTNPLTVNYTVDGTATNGSDYTSIPTSVTFEANSAIATVIVDPTADTTVEPNETVILTLATGTGYTVGTTTAVTGTITNDDTSVTLAVSPASVTEDGTTNLIYTFTRSGVTTNPLTVNYSISGTATNGSDYTSIPTSVTFAANATTATVIVDPTADTTVESDETVILTLASGTGYTIGTPDAVIGTITNDDLPSITLAISPASVTEDGTSNLIYTFTRTGDTTNPLTVNYTVDGTATNEIDYTSIPTSVTFAANSATATVTVDPTADTTVESDETVILTLAAGTGYTVGTTNPVTGTINNDDFSQLSINNITVVEGLDNNAILTVTVDNPNPQPISFNYTTAPIDATADVDYTSKTGTITIAANTSTATISIPILNDNLNEPDEIFTVTLSNAVNATINPEGGIGEVIITDTWQTSLTRTLPNNVENLRLISSNNVNGTGNAGNNKITGNSGINQINGANGADTLTGGLGADTFIFQFGQSTISTSDRITDFAINSDKIDLLTQAGNATSAPSNFSRAANSTVTTLQNLVNQVFTDANGAITGNQGVEVNSAALVQVTTGAIAGTYLVINDSAAGFQSSNDLLINITGFTGTLPALGNIPVGNFFI